MNRWIEIDRKRHTHTVIKTDIQRNKLRHTQTGRYQNRRKQMMVWNKGLSYILNIPSRKGKILNFLIYAFAFLS